MFRWKFAGGGCNYLHKIALDSVAKDLEHNDVKGIWIMMEAAAHRVDFSSL